MFVAGFRDREGKAENTLQGHQGPYETCLRKEEKLGTQRATTSIIYRVAVLTFERRSAAAASTPSETGPVAGLPLV